MNTQAIPHDKDAIIFWQEPEDWETRLDALLIQDEGISISIQQRDGFIEVHKECLDDLIKILKSYKTKPAKS